MHPWQEWMSTTLKTLSQIPLDENLDRGAKVFFNGFYRLNMPCILDTPKWPALNWTFEYLKEKVGFASVEIQSNRNADPNYELNAYSHKFVSSFNHFVDGLLEGEGNDTYLTAQNHAANVSGLRSLYQDIRPLPDILTNSSDAGFFWMGRDTVTPLHHDLTNNLLCQILGRKLIRMVSPDQFEKIEHNTHVHSKLGWMTKEKARERGILFTDWIIEPGQMLFLPIGWFHCVRSYGPNISVSFTNFIWNNNYSHNFRA